MSDLLAQTAPDGVLLLGAAGALGVAAAAAVIAVGSRVSREMAPVVAQLSEIQRRQNRQRIASASPVFALVLTLLPIPTFLGKRLPARQVKSELAHWYARAGWPGGLSDDELFGLGILVGLAIGALVSLGLSILAPFPLGLIGFVMAALGPTLVKGHFQSEAKTREKAIGRTLPYVIDLLVLTMKSGASLPIALRRVADDYRGHPVGEEFRMMINDFDMGSTSREAWENLAKRAPIPVVKVMVDDVLQSEELGQPIADTLERLSDRSRTRRVQDAKATAGQAKVMVLMPMMLVFFASLLLLFAPFIVRYLTGTFGEQG